MSNLTMFGILYRMWLTLGNLLSSPYKLFLGIVMTFKSSDPTKDGTIMSDVKEDAFEVIVDAGTVPSREDVSLSEVITDPGTNTEEVIVSTSVPEDVEVVSDTGIVTSRVNKEDILSLKDGICLLLLFVLLVGFLGYLAYHALVVPFLSEEHLILRSVPKPTLYP